MPVKNCTGQLQRHKKEEKPRQTFDMSREVLSRGQWPLSILALQQDFRS